MKNSFNCSTQHAYQIYINLKAKTNIAFGQVGLCFNKSVFVHKVTKEDSIRKYGTIAEWRENKGKMYAFNS